MHTLTKHAPTLLGTCGILAFAALAAALAWDLAFGPATNTWTTGYSTDTYRALLWTGLFGMSASWTCFILTARNN